MRSLLATPLPFPLVLALRYLRSTRRDAYTSFLSAVAAAGIALGVAALILVLAALAGLHQVLTAQILAATAELEVELPPGSDAGAARGAALGVPGVTAAEVLIRGQGWLLAGAQPVPVKLVGFSGRLPASFPWPGGGPPPAEGLYLDEHLALRYGLERGEVVTVVSPRPTLTPLGPQPRSRSLPLAGTFVSGPAETEVRVALPLAVAESLLGRRGRLLEVSTGDLERALAVAPALTAALPPGAAVRTWREINRSLFFVLKLEKRLMFFAVALIVMVAALALVVDLALILSSKRREIGMLGAMGAPPSALRRAFLLLGGLLAGLGAAAGVVLGLAGAWILDHYRVLSVPGQVMFVPYIPFQARLADVAAVLAFTAAATLAATLYAARRAAALEPVAALRR